MHTTTPATPVTMKRAAKSTKAAAPPAMTELNWDDLRFLRAALRAGSLAGAARALRVEHTTVGRRLSALERVLGAPVVVRAPDGLRPTAIGAELAPLLDDIDRIVNAAHA